LKAKKNYPLVYNKVADRKTLEKSRKIMVFYKGK
jgi:hypothetical protein